MRYAKWTLAAVLLVVAASAVYAECGACNVVVPAPAPVAVCPAPCPVACPQPCPQPCPQVCPCPATAVPAALGAGPASLLPCDTCAFDPAYASAMFAQNSVILAVTQYGMTRANDGNLRDISGEINGYLTSANNKLQNWYGSMACAVASPDCAKAQAIIDQLAATPANCFNAVYATTLAALLRQSNTADSIGGTRALAPPMRQQAQFLSRKSADWAFRLDRWVAENGV